jgi:hypothetical protein
MYLFIVCRAKEDNLNSKDFASHKKQKLPRYSRSFVELIKKSYTVKNSHFHTGKLKLWFIY